MKTDAMTPLRSSQRYKATMMLFRRRWRIAILNVGGSPETPTYIEKMMQNHGVDIAGITETHLIPERKIRTKFFSFNAVRPPPKIRENLGVHLSSLEEKQR